MFNSTKKKLVLTALAVLALGNTMPVSAASQINSAVYSGYVTKTADYVTASLYKTTLGAGTNKVSSIDAGASLCSWINNYIGMRVTEKAYYDLVTTKSMTFTTDDISIDTPGGHLSTTMTVSTQWYEFSSANTSGTWSPDPF